MGIVYDDFEIWFRDNRPQYIDREDGLVHVDTDELATIVEDFIHEKAREAERNTPNNSAGTPFKHSRVIPFVKPKERSKLL